MTKIDEVRDAYEKFGFIVTKTTKNDGGNFLYLEIYTNEEMLRKGHYLTSLQFNNEGSKLQFIGLTIDYNKSIYVPV